VFQTRKYLHENSVYECLSQHTFAQELGAPYVYNYTEGDAESALNAVRLAVDYNGGRGFPPFVPPDHTPEVVTRRIIESLETHFHMDLAGGCNKGMPELSQAHDIQASGGGDAASLTRDAAEKSVLTENAPAHTDYGVLVGKDTIALTPIEGHSTMLPTKKRKPNRHKNRYNSGRYEGRGPTKP